MKVAVLPITPPDLVGAGTTETTVNIGQYFRQQGDEVHILAICPKQKSTSVKDIKTLCFKSNVLPDFSVSLLKHLLTHNYDKYIFVGSSHIAFSVSMLMLKAKSKEIVLIPQWHSAYSFRNMLTALLFSVKRFFFDYFMLKLVQPTTVCYTKEESLHLKKFLQNIVVVPLGLNFNRQLWTIYDNINRNEIPNCPRLLFVGRVERDKLPPFIVDVLRTLKTRVSGEFMFYVVGFIEDAAYLAKVQDRLKHANLGSNVVFTGPVSERDLAGYYKNADVFVSPSFSESFGYTIVEALYATLPVVATKTGISPYLERLGLITTVDFGDVEAMASRIYESLQTTTEVKLRLLRERYSVKSRFDTVNFLNRLYLVVINKSPIENEKMVEAMQIKGIPQQVDQREVDR